LISRLTVNELVKIVHENESIHIPIGSVHRLENPGKILLELIEVQRTKLHAFTHGTSCPSLLRRTSPSSYLGEDDIIRVEDDYQLS
jgi:mannose-1-phosphate guanylyltransferase/mannose-6-phosphate isomerase